MSDAIEVKSSDGKFKVPSRTHVEEVVRGGPWNDCRTFSGTLWHLLMSGFCLTLMIGCATPSPELTAMQLALRTADAEILTQTTKAVDGISENTQMLREIRTKLDTLEAAQVKSEPSPGKEVIKSVEDTSPADNANDSQPVTRSVAEAGDVPLYIFVTPFCQPCNAAKRDWKNGKLKGFDVKFCVQTESHRQSLIAEDIPADRIVITEHNATPFPAISYQSDESATGWKFHQPHGYGPRILMELRATLLGEDPLPAVQEFPQTLAPMQSHGDLVSIHNRLHGGGQWTWPGDLATHLRQSHGVNLNGTSANYQSNPVVRSRSVVSTVSRGPVVSWRSRSVLRSNCPNGRCP